MSVAQNEGAMIAAPILQPLGTIVQCELHISTKDEGIDGIGFMKESALIDIGGDGIHYKRIIHMSDFGLGIDSLNRFDVLRRVSDDVGGGVDLVIAVADGFVPAAVADVVSEVGEELNGVVWELRSVEGTVEDIIQVDGVV